MKEARRNFLKISCLTAAGAAVAGGLSLVNPKAAHASYSHPFGYPIGGLDVETTREIGYQGYKGISPYTSNEIKECASAVFTTIIGQLRDAFASSGSGYDAIPLEMMNWGSGGMAGMGSVCGALNGACAAIGLICAPADANLYITDLLTWYSETALPIYPTPQYPDPHAQSVASSNLCHVSVTQWCLASGLASGSPERSDRCACLCADVASFIVDKLNNDVKGVLGNPRDNNTVCGQCHYKGTDYSGGQFTRGKMNCLHCHTDITKASAQGHHNGQQ